MSTATKESKKVRQPVLTSKYCVEAEQLDRQIQKRISSYDSKSDAAMFKELPKKILELDSLIRTHPYLQLDFPHQLEEKMMKHLLVVKDEGVIAPQPSVSETPKSETKKDSVNVTVSNEKTANENNKPEENESNEKPIDVKLQINADMNDIIEYLSVPPLCIYELEQLVRKHATDITNIFMSINIWLTLVSTSSVQKSNPVIAEISQSVAVAGDCSQQIASSVQYHVIRARNLDKLRKKRIFDYAKIVIANDIEMVSSCRDLIQQMLNSISVAYQLIQKHIDTLLRPNTKDLGDNMF